MGCIPSKALLHASELVHEAEGNFKKMGIIAKDVSVDIPQMLSYKAEVIESNTKGIEFLFKKNKVDWIKGWAEIAAPGQVKVDGTVHNTKNIVIATGSEPAQLRGVEVDEERVVTSTGALDLKEVPKRLCIIGAGVIGLELGSVWGRLGAEVTVIEFLDHITPGQDAEVQRQFQKILTKQGFTFILNSAVSEVVKGNEALTVKYTARKDDSQHELETDVVLVATGRRAFTTGLGLEAVGIETDRGMVKTDGHWRTNIPGIWAIGDVIAGPMLAHKAEDEGMAVAESIAGQKGHVNYNVIPGVIYTAPEVAAVGHYRRRAQSRRQEIQGRQVLLHGEWAGQGQSRHGGLRQTAR